MISETLTLMAVLKTCQAGVLLGDWAIDNEMRGNGEPEIRMKNFLGTKRKDRVSNAATAHPIVSHGQRLAATPIPSRGGVA